MEPLTLTTPEQHDYNDPTVERDAERLRAWLSNLPIMDVVQALRLVQGALDSLNEQKLEPEKRYQLLDMFRHTAERLYVTVDPLRIRQLSLTKSQREQATRGVERLSLAMAGGYKIIVKALYEAAAQGPPGNLFGLAINRAIEQLGSILIDSYRFYRAVQESLFAELHQLYRLARYFGLLAVTAANEDSEQPPGIAECYHAIMLLALTDPFRLAEGEAGLLHDVLKQHAGQCRVIPGSHWSVVPDGLYLLDLKSDAPPEFCTQLGQQVAIAQEPYLLDAREALHAIRERLELTPVKVRGQSPEAMLLRRLLPEESVTQRRESRHPDNRGTHLVTGLDAIHTYLLHVPLGGVAAAESAINNVPVKPSPCRIVDSSEHGMRLAWDEGIAGDACVGDLLGIVNDGQCLQLAIARSVQIHPMEGMEIGVEIMRGNCGPVYCHAQADDEAKPIRALFMLSSGEDDVAATLVMAKGYYEPGRRLLIDSSGRAVRARAGHNVSDSPMFDRFEFATDES